MIFHALDDLLGRSRGPLGEPVEVDLGDDAGPLAELAALLSRRNGFYAFNMGLQVFRIGERGAGPELRRWNEHPWKRAYEPLAADLFCFAQDLFGGQFAIDGDGQVLLFDAEDGQRVLIGSSLETWAGWLLDEPDLRGCDAFARGWQHRYRPLGHDERLRPVVMACLGGDYALDSLEPVTSEEAMTSRGPIAQQLARRREDQP